MDKRTVLKILLVDDEEIVRNTLHDFLEYLGHIATGVENGIQGLKAIETSDYDAAFVDIKMPVMDGLTFLTRLNEVKKNIPVVIMTGHGSDQTHDQAISAGAIGFLYKPFGLTEIQDTIAEIKKYLNT